MVAPDAKTLRAIDAFRSLPDAVLERIAALVMWREVASDQVIFHEGDPVTAVYLLRRGRVKVATVSADGREQLLHVLEPGAVFPRVGLFRGGAYPATAWMDEAGVVGVIAKEAVLDLARSDGDVAGALLGMMEGVVLELQERIRSLALQDVKSRVLQLLMRESSRGMTHQEIAAFVGAARETVTRAIAELRRQGIDVSGRGQRAARGSPHDCRGR